MFKSIVKKLVATAVVAASVFLAVVFLGVAIFYAPSLTLTPLGAAAAAIYERFAAAGFGGSDFSGIINFLRDGKH